MVRLFDGADYHDALTVMTFATRRFGQPVISTGGGSLHNDGGPRRQLQRVVRWHAAGHPWTRASATAPPPPDTPRIQHRTGARASAPHTTRRRRAWREETGLRSRTTRPSDRRARRRRALAPLRGTSDCGRTDRDLGPPACGADRTARGFRDRPRQTSRCTTGQAPRQPLPGQYRHTQRGQVGPAERSRIVLRSALARKRAAGR